MCCCAHAHRSGVGNSYPGMDRRGTNAAPPVRSPPREVDCFMTANRPRVSTIEFVRSCHKVPALITYRVRCGSPGCRCAGEVGHGPYWFLRWRDRTGKHCRRYVRLTDVEAVRSTIAERRAERTRARFEARAALAWLRSSRKMIAQIEREHGV